MAREWAYGLTYRTHRHRNKALPHWLDHYNRTRPHSSLGDQPPISRVHNVRGVGQLGAKRGLQPVRDERLVPTMRQVLPASV
jgi:transposase InsO family protein